MNYKDTLHIPKTDFEMRGNLAKKEPGILETWESNDHYNEIIKRHKDQKPFILHDGPPYANGDLHAGTAMNRVIKDFIIRTHAMSDYYTPFFPKLHLLNFGIPRYFFGIFLKIYQIQ